MKISVLFLYTAVAFHFVSPHLTSFAGPIDASSVSQCEKSSEEFKQMLKNFPPEQMNELMLDEKGKCQVCIHAPAKDFDPASGYLLVDSNSVAVSWKGLQEGAYAVKDQAVGIYTMLKSGFKMASRVCGAGEEYLMSGGKKNLIMDEARRQKADLKKEAFSLITADEMFKEINNYCGRAEKEGLKLSSENAEFVFMQIQTCQSLGRYPHAGTVSKINAYFAAHKLSKTGGSLKIDASVKINLTTSEVIARYRSFSALTPELSETQSYSAIHNMDQMLESAVGSLVKQSALDKWAGFKCLPSTYRTLVEGQVSGSLFNPLKALTYLKWLKGAGLGKFGQTVRNVEKVGLVSTDILAAEKTALTVSGAKTLGRALSEKEAEALMKAHVVGRGEAGKVAGVKASKYNYTSTQLRNKVKILRDAGYSEAEARTLVKAGVAGDYDRFTNSINESFGRELSRNSKPLGDRFNYGDEVLIWRTNGDISKAYVIAEDGPYIEVHWKNEAGQTAIKRNLPKESVTPIFKSGMEVRVPRTGGGFSNGRVSSVNNGVATVDFNDATTGQMMKKNVAFENLSRSRSPASASAGQAKWDPAADETNRKIKAQEELQAKIKAEADLRAEQARAQAHTEQLRAEARKRDEELNRQRLRQQEAVQAQLKRDQAIRDGQSGAAREAKIESVLSQNLEKMKKYGSELKSLRTDLVNSQEFLNRFKASGNPKAVQLEERVEHFKRQIRDMETEILK